MNDPKKGRSSQMQGSPTQSSREGEGERGMQRSTGQGESLQRRGSPQGMAGYGGGWNTPFRMMRRMMEDMDRMFENFGFGGGMSGLMTPFDEDLMSPQTLGGWNPQVEVFERDGNLVVRADLPGIEQEDVHVNVEDDALVIAGERKSEHESRERGVFHSERSYGSFQRRIALPRGVDVNTCDASFDNGVLEVKVKLPKETKRSIDIKKSAAQGASTQTQTTQNAQQSGRGQETMGQNGGQAAPPRH